MRLFSSSNVGVRKLTPTYRAKPAAIDFVMRKAERNAERPQCFPVDTQVFSEYGLAEIDRLSVGTRVLSRCEKTGEQAYRRITKTYVHARQSEDDPRTPLYTIKIANSDGFTDSVHASAEHPFWVNGVGWVKARDLQPGQMLEICDPFSGDGDHNLTEDQRRENVIFSGQRWQMPVLSVEQEHSTGIVYSAFRE